ncbi:MAG: hypothetical protein JWN22_235 [Nocardioides sp.]|nr:hypothetical protein [Nocardioides sp.]
MMFGGAPPWGEFIAVPESVRIDVTFTDESVRVQLGRFVGTDPDDGVHYDDDIHVVPDPGGRRPRRLRPLPARGRPPDQLTRFRDRRLRAFLDLRGVKPA